LHCCRKQQHLLDLCSFILLLIGWTLAISKVGQEVDDPDGYSRTWGYCFCPALGLMAAANDKWLGGPETLLPPRPGSNLIATMQLLVGLSAKYSRKAIAWGESVCGRLHIEILCYRWISCNAGRWWTM
jgi:hypothetical protein